MSEFENDVIVRAAKGEKEELYDLQLEISLSVQWIFFARKAAFEENCADEAEVEELRKWRVKRPMLKIKFTKATWYTWKREAVEVAELAKVNKETREIALRMVGSMESVEKRLKAQVIELSDLWVRKIEVRDWEGMTDPGKEHMRIFEACAATPSLCDQLSRKLTNNSHRWETPPILRPRGLLPRVAPPAEGSLGHDSHRWGFQLTPAGESFNIIQDDSIRQTSS
jgi:hypothetical protein